MTIARKSSHYITEIPVPFFLIEQLEERGYYAALKQLVEDTYTQNGNVKVSLLAFSIGGPVSHFFLTRVVNQEWKDTYIHSYIPIAAAWSGKMVFQPY